MTICFYFHNIKLLCFDYQSTCPTKLPISFMCYWSVKVSNTYFKINILVLLDMLHWYNHIYLSVPMMPYWNWCHTEQLYAPNQSPHWMYFYWWNEWFYIHWRNPTKSIVWSQQQVCSTIVGRDLHQGPRAWPTFWHMPQIQRVSVLFHIFHELNMGLVADDNVYLILSLHWVSHMSHQISMQ